jgi:hypothetical protein
MPNWSRNKIVTTRKVAKKLYSRKTGVDFNRVFPMPKSLNMEDGTTTDEAIVCFLTDKFTRPFTDRHYLLIKEAKRGFLYLDKEYYQTCSSYIDLSDKKNLQKLYNTGKQCISNYAKYGAFTWYDWCCENWGTKWNASDTSINVDRGEVTIYFDTAWSLPMPVIEALCAMYPNDKLVAESEVEDGYYYKFENQNGKLVQLECEDIEELYAE